MPAVSLTTTTEVSPAVAGITLAGKVVDKLDNPLYLLTALALIFGIIVVGLLLRKSLGEKSYNEKVRAAEAENLIAANRTSTFMHEGQSEELHTLYTRFGVLEGDVGILKNEAVSMKARILHLESALSNVSLHFDNLVLCKHCQEVNKVTLLSIRRILDAANQTVPSQPPMP